MGAAFAAHRKWKAAITLRERGLSWNERTRIDAVHKGLCLIRCAAAQTEWRKEIHQARDARLFRDRPPQVHGATERNCL